MKSNYTHGRDGVHGRGRDTHGDGEDGEIRDGGPWVPGDALDHRDDEEVLGVGPGGEEVVGKWWMAAEEALEAGLEFISGFPEEPEKARPFASKVRKRLA